ncbi:hypothetical protein C6P77_26295 [Burkholderia ambifaria]|nr:hypothetical protein C6P77_26295 [Burkholderia ambifaria]
MQSVESAKAASATAGFVRQAREIPMVVSDQGHQVVSEIGHDDTTDTIVVRIGDFHIYAVLNDVMPPVQAFCRH